MPNIPFSPVVAAMNVDLDVSNGSGSFFRTDHPAAYTGHVDINAIAAAATLRSREFMSRPLTLTGLEVGAAKTADQSRSVGVYSLSLLAPTSQPGQHSEPLSRPALPNSCIVRLHVPMCNLYSVTKGQSAMHDATRGL